MEELRQVKAQLTRLEEKHGANGIYHPHHHAEAPHEVVAAKPTPMELLQQGLVAEAVRAALDEKDILQMVDLLGELTPQQVISKCSHIIRLCITQQLAADMSVNMPVEGIAQRLEWIKLLVLSVIRIPAAEVVNDLSFKRSFPSMIQAVLESIQAAKELISAAQYDNGEDNAMEIPQSVHADLQLLEIVMQTATGY